MRLQRFLPFLLAFLLPILVVYVWWGGFNPVAIHAHVMRGPYHYVYLEHVGDYAKLNDRQAEVRHRLAEAGIVPGASITVLFSDPRQVERRERRAHIGYLLPVAVEVKAPLAVAEIPARPVLRAEVRAAILLAPSRAYQAIDDYLRGQGTGIRMPSVELYQSSETVFGMGLFSVEVPE